MIPCAACLRSPQSCVVFLPDPVLSIGSSTLLSSASCGTALTFSDLQSSIDFHKLQYCIDFLVGASVVLFL